MSYTDFSAASPRGQFGVIYSSILTSRKFRELSKDGRHGFISLKLHMPMEGIMWSAAWHLELAKLTDMTPDEATAAIADLCRVGFCEFDGELLWIIDGLRWEPSMAGKLSPKTAIGIVRRVAPMADCDIKRRWQTKYRNLYLAAVENGKPKAEQTSYTLFDDSSDNSLDTPIGWGLPSPPDVDADAEKAGKAVAVPPKVTKKAARAVATKTAPKAAEAPAPSAPAPKKVTWLTPYESAWKTMARSEHAEMPFGQFAAPLKTAQEKLGVDKAIEDFRDYLATVAITNKRAKRAPLDFASGAAYAKQMGAWGLACQTAMGGN